MTRTNRTRLCVSAAAIALGLSQPALADEAAAAADDSAGLETIVVTAQKRETNLQSTPIAISVLGVTISRTAASRA